MQAAGENECVWSCLVKMVRLSLERPSSCTNISVFWKRFQVFLDGTNNPWLCQVAWSFPMPFSSSVGFTIVLLAAWLPLFWLFPPGIHPFPDVVEMLGGSFRTQCLVLQSKINSTVSWMSLNLLEGRGIHWKSLGSSNVEIRSALLLPLPV